MIGACCDDSPSSALLPTPRGSTEANSAPQYSLRKIWGKEGNDRDTFRLISYCAPEVRVGLTSYPTRPGPKSAQRLNDVLELNTFLDSIKKWKRLSSDILTCTISSTAFICCGWSPATTKWRNRQSWGWISSSRLPILRKKQPVISEAEQKSKATKACG